VDVLSDTIAALRTGRPGSGTFVRHAPWGRRYSKAAGAGFHVVLQGSCWLIPRDAEPVAMGVGDVALLYLDEGHGLADSPDTPLDEIPGPGEPSMIEGPGARSTLLCGVYEFAPGWSHPLLDDLPEVVHVPARLGRHPQLRAAVDLLTTELAGGLPGRDAMVPALLDVLLICTLRAWFEEQANDDRITGWASVFRDPAITAALTAMHDDPARQWTVEELGARAGMSRATFSRRFTALVGEPPLTYLTRWRMITAARRLRETDAGLATIAREVGYASEYAFAKAFKRAHGAAPGHYRRHELDPTPAPS
jgi:AraC-like DNA-binding protein